MKYLFEELIDKKQLQKLTDSLYSAFGLPSAIVTVEGKIITASGWQEICTDFHRKNPETEKDCIESDTQLSKMQKDGKKYAIYNCPRGLVDSSSPVIIEGNHVANVFTCQFFYEPPTDETELEFRKQAKQYDFDEESYISAFRKIPVIPEEKHHLILDVLVNFAEMLSNIGLTRKRELEKTREVEESEKKYRLLIQNSNDITILQDPDGLPIFISPQIEKILGYGPEEFKNIKIPKQIHPDDLANTIEANQRAFSGKELINYEYRFKKKNGEYCWLSHTARPLFNNGILEGVHSNVSDITDRKKTEKVLNDKLYKLERLNELMINRELKMVELKKEVNDLLKQLGKEKKY